MMQAAVCAPRHFDDGEQLTLLMLLEPVLDIGFASLALYTAASSRRDSSNINQIDR
jgi:hypothetical protein